MRVEPSSVHWYWTLVALAGLTACAPEAPPPVIDAVGNYQPANLAEAVVLANRTAVENFLALGVDPNEPEADGTTPLMRAVHGQTPALAQLLIDAGADANAVLPAGETVLMTAAKAGNAEVVRAVLTGGLDGVSLSQLGEARASARIAEAAGYSLPTNPAFATNYADVNARERYYGRTALMMASAEGHATVVELLIEAGADLNLVDEEGATALSLARSYGHLDVAAKLADAGAAG